MSFTFKLHPFNLKIRLSLGSFKTLSWLTVILLASGCAQAQSQPQALETHYSDCSYVEFDEIDPSQLTREERIALEEAALFGSLDKSTKCMDQAAADSAEALAAAASAGADSANAEAGGDGAGENSTSADSETQSDPTATTSGGSVSNQNHERGEGKGGSSAVCDAVKAGLENATTDAEKEHFKSLMAEYGC